MRTFESGATRDDNENKLKIHRFMSPEVQLSYCEYLQKHRVQADGNLRDPDNWKKGMDKSVYFESLTRHFFEAWVEFERTGTVPLEVMHAIRFNVDGFVFETLQKKQVDEFNSQHGCIPESVVIHIPSLSDIAYPPLCPCGAKDGEEHKSWCGYSD